MKDFAGKILIFASEISILESLAASEVISETRYFQMTEFGHRLREDLVTRWCRVGINEDIDEVEFHKRVIRIKEHLDEILAGNLLDSYPIFILILLQTFESHAEQVPDISNAHLFEALITARLHEVSGTMELDILYGFLSFLAHSLSEKEEGKISINRLVRILKEFAGKHYLEFNETKFIDRLVDSRILAERNGVIGFRYRYFQFYFQARYMSRHLNENQKIDFLRNHARTLHMEESQNVLVFSSFFGNAQQIAELVVGELATIKPEGSSLRMDTDSEIYKKIYIELPKQIALEVSGDYKQRRDRFHQQLDRFERKKRRDEEQTRDKAAFGEAKDLNRLYKGMSVLGEILKGSPGSIDAEQKSSMTKAARDSAVKCLNTILELIEFEYSSVSARVKSALEKRGDLTEQQKENLTRFFLGLVIELCSLNVLKKASQCLSRDHLSPIIKDCINVRDDLYTNVIGLLAAQDTFRVYPTNDVIEFARSVKTKNSYMFNLIRYAVHRHMLIEKPMKYQLKQKLGHALQIDVKGTDEARQLKKR